MADRTLRVACIGCGGNMRGHIGRLLKIPKVKIVGIADPFPAGLETAQKQYAELAKTPTFADYGALLDATKPDAVVISTPHNVHAEQILASLEHGADVLCEKPMTCTSAEATAVCGKAKETGRTVQVSYQRHQSSLFRWMREAVASGLLGPLEYVAAQQYQSWADHFRARPEAWRLSPEQSGGGQLNDSGSHLMDILLHVTNLEPRRVSCIQQRFEFQVDINSTITIEYEGGAHGSIAIVGGARGISTAVFEDLTLIGSEKAVYYRMFGRPQEPLLEVRSKGEREPDAERPTLPPSQNPDEAFVAVVRGQQANEAPPECGLRAIRLTEACWRSAAENGAMVDV